MSRIEAHARSSVRRALGSVAVKLSTVLLMAFAIGAVAGVSPGGGQGNFASALLPGGLIKSAQAQHTPGATPGAGLLAKTGDAERMIAPQWRVMSVRGKAEVREGSRIWHRWNSAKPGALLNNRAQGRTGPDAEVNVSNGHDTLTLAPDSTLEIPAADAERGLTQVVQTRGTINYDIESRLLPGTKEDRPSLKKVLFSTQRLRGRFEVVTPFLIVGVKGTNFDVDVDASGASVEVSEGVVDVETPDGGSSATIVAGQSADVPTQSGHPGRGTARNTYSANPEPHQRTPAARPRRAGLGPPGIRPRSRRLHQLRAPSRGPPPHHWRPLEGARLRGSALCRQGRPHQRWRRRHRAPSAEVAHPPQGAHRVARALRGRARCARWGFESAR